MSNLIQNTKKALMAVAAVGTLATGVTFASTDSAEAQWRGRYVGGPGFRAHRGWGPGYGYHRGWRGNRGAAVAAGVFGLAAGALIAGAASNAYAAPSYGYGYVPAYQPSYGYYPSYGYGYSPVTYGGYYGAPAYSYQPTCYVRRVRLVDDWGRVIVRRSRVCG